MSQTTSQSDAGLTLDDLALYHMPYCPYCVRVFREAERMGLDLDLRDTSADPQHRADLIAGGGKRQVPCLRIQRPDGRVEWLYESLDIIDFLRQRFA